MTGGEIPFLLGDFWIKSFNIVKDLHHSAGEGCLLPSTDRWTDETDNQPNTTSLTQREVWRGRYPLSQVNILTFSGC